MTILNRLRSWWADLCYPLSKVQKHRMANMIRDLVADGKIMPYDGEMPVDDEEILNTEFKSTMTANDET